MGDQDVGRLEIAVNQAGHLLLGVLHAQRHVQPEGHRLRQADPVVLDPGPQVRPQPFRAADVLQEDMRPVVDGAHHPRLDDVGVLLQPDPGQRLLHKAGDGALVAEETRLEALNRHRLALLVVVAQVDNAHPAAQHLGHLVALLNALAGGELVLDRAGALPAKREIRHIHRRERTLGPAGTVGQRRIGRRFQRRDACQRGQRIANNRRRRGLDKLVLGVGQDAGQRV